jgi:ATP-binding cassette subfamily B protein
LRNIDLFVPKGQSLALVGENGAGKTTFIKLLSGLYRRAKAAFCSTAATSTTGTSRRCAPHRRHLSGLQPVPTSAAREHRLRQRRALARRPAPGPRGRAGRRARAGGQPFHRLETQLGRWFKEGVDLSGGQWQKVALARAFMRDEADILILDEPTAALDAEAEHAVFQRFRALAEGRTTILISHRFPTVRMADRIVVLEGGPSSNKAPTPSCWPPAPATPACSLCRPRGTVDMETLGGLAAHSAPATRPATPALRAASPNLPAMVRAEQSSAGTPHALTRLIC